MIQILSLSLWGSSPKYTTGAVKNIELAPIIYPGWKVRLYLDKISFDIIKDEINKYDYVQSIICQDVGNWNGMFWRFLPALEQDVDVMISRDCDSRISLREKLAVDEWLSSNKDFHIMRDHPFHNTVILGGMWGCRNQIFQKSNITFNPNEHESFWQVDQNFLREKVYPRVVDNCFIHDNYCHFGENNCKHFPSERINKHFVGEIFDEFDNRHPDHYTLL